MLGWALAGGLDTEFPIEVFGVPIPFIPSIKLTPLTPVSEFRQKYDKVLDAFQQMGAKGVCATIPNVSTIPNLNTINEERIGHPLWITVVCFWFLSFLILNLKCSCYFFCLC